MTQAKMVRIEKNKLNPYLPKGTIDQIVITMVDGSKLIVEAESPYGEDGALKCRYE